MIRPFRGPLAEFLNKMAATAASSDTVFEQAPAGSALAKINALAKGIQTKRPLLTLQQARGQVMAERRDLLQAAIDEAY